MTWKLIRFVSLFFVNLLANMPRPNFHWSYTSRNLNCFCSSINPRENSPSLAVPILKRKGSHWIPRPFRFYASLGWQKGMIIRIKRSYLTFSAFSFIFLLFIFILLYIFFYLFILYISLDLPFFKKNM